jgi:hypothetical protein
MPTARGSGALVSIYGSRVYYASAQYQPAPTATSKMLLLEAYTPAVCDASSAPANGGVGTCTDSLPVGSSCQPVCNSGYTASGTTTCVAAASSTGSLSPATCLAASSCNAATPPTNGLVGTCGSSLAANAMCWPECSVGYVISGPTVCGASGALSTTATCLSRPVWVSRNALPFAPYNSGQAAVVHGNYMYVAAAPPTSYLRYSALTDAWTSVTRVPRTSVYAATALMGAYVYVAAWDPSTPGPSALADTLKSSITVDGWTTARKIPTRRDLSTDGTAAGVVGNRMYVAGGRDPTAFQLNEVYTSAGDVWTTAMPLPTGRFSSCTTSKGSRIFVALGWLGPPSYALTHTLEIYSALSDSWTTGMFQ